MKVMLKENPAEGLLNISQVYTYSQLCTALGTIALTGCAKETQLAEWGVYFQFQKKGRFFVIQKLFQNEELENQKFNYCLTKLVRVSLLEFLKPLIAAQVRDYPGVDSKTPGIISVERNNLLTLVGLANGTFSDKAFSKKTDEEVEFFRQVRSRALADISAVCKELQKEKAVHSSEGFIIETSKFEKRSATTEEIVEIFNVYKEMLDKYGVASEAEMRVREAQVGNFYADVAALLASKLGITFHTKSFTFASSQFLIDGYLERTDKYLLGAMERLQTTNRKACERARRTAQRAFNDFKANEGMYRGGTGLRSAEHLNKEYRDNYLELQEELIAKYLELQQEELEQLQHRRTYDKVQ